MSSPKSRLFSLFSQLTTSAAPKLQNRPHVHKLCPTSFLPRAASIEPQALAIHHTTPKGTTVRRSYIEFADRARGLAYFLSKFGFKRVGILAPNTPAFLETIFAVGAAGGLHVGANYRLKADELKYIFSFAEVDCIVVDDEYLPLLDAFKKENPHIPLIVDTDADPISGDTPGPFNEAIAEGLEWDAHKGAAGWAGLNFQDIDEDSCLAIPFTSGTTSRPKGVVYTHRGAYLASLANVIEAGLESGEGEKCGYLWTLPMFHAVGWTFPWAVTAVRGTHYCLRQINYPHIWNLLKKEKISHFCAAPTVNTHLCAAKDAARLTSPVRVTVAASPPSTTLFEQMIGLNLIPTHAYGMTETYGPLTKFYRMTEWNSLSIKQKITHMTRQGHGFITSLPIRIIKTDQPSGVLVDVEKNGKEIGEVVFSGNICAKGYFNDPKATAKLWEGGFLHSGDLAVWHPDGSVQILDRQKDIIISGGENISSIALESMLLEHPAILEAAVISVQDEKWGERPLAFVTLKKTSNPMPAVTGSLLLEWAKNDSPISKFMIPRQIMIVSMLPKTATGKVKKNILRQWAESCEKGEALPQTS
ncbi:Acetate/butyrate--CoA ligase AAE7, peroxisomal [Podosphaera aphanis]|nr:Acetate/butyrate--CoA ligase AAE7, peroxisomal [Podosphaera aphanis]